MSTIKVGFDHASLHFMALISCSKTPFSQDKAVGRDEKSQGIGPLVAIKHDYLAILPSSGPKQLKGLSRSRIRLYMVFLFAFPNHLQLTITWR